LSIICIPGTDVLAHRYWKYYRPEGFEQYINKNEMFKYKNIIPNFYKKVDQEIGRITRKFPTDTNIFVISDHGFKSRESSQLFQYKIKTDDVLKYLDLSEELVYTNMGPFVVFHLKDNDKQPSRKALWNSFKKFKEVKIVQTGKNFFDAHWYDTYFGIRVIRVLTDPIEDYHVSINGKLVRIGDILRESTDTSGVHALHGILIAAGKDIKNRRKIKGAKVFDITPTVLALNVMPIAKDMDGTVLQDLIEPAFLEKNPVSYVESYGKPEFDDKERSIETENEMVKEQLRSLGYVD
jgi:predicted AlkP superfamily phosphohydrolase/phosphomutase